jgi:hypothetical protein
MLNKKIVIYKIMTRYLPSDPRDYLAALDFLNLAKEQNIEVVLDRYSPKRSGQQNRYLYFCLAWFAHCYGCTEIEAKEIYLKQLACPQLFELRHVDRNGISATYYRSTADLSKDEMAMAIRNFRTYAEINGIEIPEASDNITIRYCEQQMQRTKHFR